MKSADQHGTRTRIDKWLWAARFFKTRTLATQAVEGGKVRVDGERVKPSKEVKAGDRLQVHIGELEWRVMVIGLADRRGSAAVARTLYEEEPSSLLRRQQFQAERRLHANPTDGMKGRPTKKARRMIHRFTEQG